MKKIKFELFKWPIKFDKCETGYIADLKKFIATDSRHGKSRGIVECPCCLNENEVYLWSFAGSGKRCENCNVFLSGGGCFVGNKEAEKCELLIWNSYEHL